MSAGPFSTPLVANGRLFTLGVTAVLRLNPGQWWLDPALTMAGIALLVGFALLRERRRLSPAMAR